MIDYVFTNHPVEEATDNIVKVLKLHLEKGDRVLWLLSGGSGINVAIRASKKLEGIDLTNLFVGLTDERYGLVGHKDENWQQLLDNSLSLPGANLYRTLTGQDIDQTTTAFDNWLKSQLEKSDYKIGIFGFGADGHTAGIKPDSSAVSAPNLAASFIGDDFERITVTFKTIKQLDEVVIQASGINKLPIIRDLMNSNIPLNKQPVQILKLVPHATLYTNNKKEIKWKLQLLD